MYSTGTHIRTFQAFQSYTDKNSRIIETSWYNATAREHVVPGYE
jgi:hypothetical protein